MFPSQDFYWVWCSYTYGTAQKQIHLDVPKANACAGTHEVNDVHIQK